MSLKSGKRIKSKLKQSLGLDVGYFAKGTTFAFLQHAIGLAAGLLTSFTFGHFVSKTVFGEYNLVLSFLSLLTVISLPGIDSALTRSIAQGYKWSLILAVRTRLLLSIIGVPILLLAAIYYAQQDQWVVATTLLLSTPLFPFLYSFQSYQAQFVAQRQFDLLTFFSSISSILLAVLTLFAGIAIPGTKALIFAYLFSIIVPAFIGFLVAKPRTSPSRRDSDLVPYGLFLTVNSAFPWVVGHAGGILLANTLGVGELAIFSAASKLPSALQKSYATLSKTITAKIAGESTHGQKQIISRHWWKLIILGFVFFIPLWIASPIVIRFLFPHGYGEAATYAQWLSTMFIPLPLSWALSDVIIYQKQKRAQIIINTVPSVIKLIGYFIVIPWLHTPGLVALVIFDDYLVFILYLIAYLYSSRNKTRQRLS